MNGVARRRLLLGVALGLAACAAEPKPEPMTLKPPIPPDPVPGSIQVYGGPSATSRSEEIRARLRKLEPEILDAYDASAARDSLTEGTLQLRLAVNREGKVTEVRRVYSGVDDEVAEIVSPILRRTEFGAGPEAYVYYTLGFRHDPFEVLRVDHDFAGDPPVLVADVENRSSFRVPAIAVTVRVLGPESVKPLRVYRRRLDAAFAAGERRQVRVPIGREWATGRNTFLVSVGPASNQERPE